MHLRSKRESPGTYQVEIQIKVLNHILFLYLSEFIVDNIFITLI